MFYALANGIYGTVPFLVLFQVGFLHGALSIIQQYAGESVSLDPVTKRSTRSPAGSGSPRQNGGSVPSCALCESA